jgi:hypothetical protein
MSTTPSDSGMEPIDDKTLQDLLDRQAQQGEFTGVYSDDVEKLREWATEQLEDVKSAIIDCLNHSDKDSVRLTSAKLLLQLIYGKELSPANESGIEKLLKDLTNNE